MFKKSKKSTEKIVYNDIPNYDIKEYNTKKNKYCLCIPIINEGKRIEKELQTAKKNGIDKLVDIIICDGGSTDGSTQNTKLKKLGVNTLLVKTDVGKQGAQLRMGFDYALKRGYEGIITIDGNNKDSIEDVPKFIEKLDEGYDFVQGSRFIKGGKAINTPFIRNVSVRLLHAPIISLTAGERFTDTTNAYRAYSKKYLLHPEVNPFRSVFQTYELLAYLSVRASQLGLKTCEIPVRREYPKKQKTPTKISPLKGNFNLFKILFLNMFGKYDATKTKTNVITSYLFAFQLFLYLLLFILNHPLNVTSFDGRILGNGMMANIDIEKRIRLYLYTGILIPIFAYLLGKFNSYILKKTDYKILKILKYTSIFGIISILLRFFNLIFNKEIALMGFSTNLFLITSIFVFLVLILKLVLNLKVNEEKVKWSIVSSYPIVIFFSMVLYKLNINIGNSFSNFNMIFIISLILLLFISNIKKINFNSLKKSYIFIVLAPIIESVYLEAYNILNQYNIILDHKYRSIVLIYFIMFVCFLVFYFINIKNDKINFNYKKYYYPLILTSFILFVCQMPMINSISTDFFEQSNHGTSVYELLRFGKIPLIENFDAHMLSNELGGILYGILNNDINGAIFIGYNVIYSLMYLLLIYYLFKQIFGEDKALLFVLFLPLHLDDGLGLFYFAILPILFLINLYKKYTFSSSLMFWVSLSLACIYRLDVGFPVSMATTIVLIVASIIKKINKKQVINLLKSFSIVILIYIIFYLLVCFNKGINPISRGIEFINLAMSNVNWAYGSLGDVNKIVYPIMYFLLPIIVVSTMIHLFIKRKNIESTLLLILFSLGIFYLFNFQRGMVRHNLVENCICYSFSLILLYFATYFYAIKKKSYVFFSSYIMLLLISRMFLNTNSMVYANIFENSYNKYLTFSSHNEAYSTKVNRLNINDQMKLEYKNLKIIMNKLLKEDETFIDLTNQTLLYPLLDKKKPMYVNQSPGLLSGEKSQQYFLEEIINVKAPILLKSKTKLASDNLDGLLNDYRYYLISEYVFSNYKPVASIDGYDIWTLIDNYDSIKSSLINLKLENIIFYENNKDSLIENKIFDLCEIPYIWGQYDTKIKVNNKVIEKLKTSDNNLYNINLSKINKTKGNYLLLNIDSKEETNVGLVLKSKKSTYTYNFIVKPGLNNYAIRISTNYGWYNSKNFELKIKNDNIKVSSIEVLEGDLLYE